MYKKICMKCHLPSFGSDNSSKWVCPVCGEDLSQLKSFDTDESKIKSKSIEYKSFSNYSFKDYPKYEFNELI